MCVLCVYVQIFIFTAKSNYVKKVIFFSFIYFFKKMFPQIWYIRVLFLFCLFLGFITEITLNKTKELNEATKKKQEMFWNSVKNVDLKEKNKHLWSRMIFP